MRSSHCTSYGKNAARQMDTPRGNVLGSLPEVRQALSTAVVLNSRDCWFSKPAHGQDTLRHQDRRHEESRHPHTTTRYEVVRLCMPPVKVANVMLVGLMTANWSASQHNFGLFNLQHAGGRA
jgi:hypothetical protein